MRRKKAKDGKERPQNKQQVPSCRLIGQMTLLATCFVFLLAGSGARCNEQVAGVELLRLSAPESRSGATNATSGFRAVAPPLSPPVDPLSVAETSLRHNNGENRPRPQQVARSSSNLGPPVYRSAPKHVDEAQVAGLLPGKASRQTQGSEPLVSLNSGLEQHSRASLDLHTAAGHHKKKKKKKVIIVKKKKKKKKKKHHKKKIIIVKKKKKKKQHKKKKIIVVKKKKKKKKKKKHHKKKKIHVHYHKKHSFRRPVVKEAVKMNRESSGHGHYGHSHGQHHFAGGVGRLQGHAAPSGKFYE